MRETKFIEQNREKWARYEEMLRENRRDPEHLNELFVQIMDDLSYARTFYPNRSVRMYLNSLAQRIFHNVYRGKRFPKERLRLFWTDEVPKVIWESRQAMLLSLSIFILAFSIGVLSSMINPDFARIILGDDYVEMTLSNIENGDPMRVYKESRPLGMSVGIAANNLFVALRTALFGVIASIGTVFIMLYNGIMVGAFQYFFIERGLFWESFLTIWIHGTLEISAIIIAGGAGLVAGSGILFPGTYTRVRAFQLSMRKGMKIMIGLTPIIILAALFEGFLTRYTDTPDVIRGLFILLSLTFVLWYFVWLPWYKAHHGFRDIHREHDLPPDRTDQIDFRAIKSTGELLSDAFTVMRRHPRLPGLGIFGAAACFTAITIGFASVPASEVFIFTDGSFGVFDGVQSFFTTVSGRHVLFTQIVILSAITLAVFKSLEAEMPEEMPESLPPWRVVYSMILLWVPAGLLSWILSAEPGISVWFLGIFFLPPLYLWAAVQYFDVPNPFLALGRTFSFTRLSQSLTIGFLLVNLSLMLFLFLDSGIWRIIIGFFSWLVPPGEGSMNTFVSVVTVMAAAAAFYFAFQLLVLTAALHLFSALESTEARALRDKIGAVGMAPKIRGLAREESRHQS